MCLYCGAAHTSATSADLREEQIEILTSRCAFCHGENGVSQSPLWPSLAGLDAAYLMTQMRDFRSWPEGGRRSQHALQMAFVLNPLSDDQLSALASYYSQLDDPWSARPVETDLEGSGTVGEQLFLSGKRDLKEESVTVVPACISCHGQQGMGNKEMAAPRIAGQFANYTANQLRAYRDGMRLDSNGVMASAVAGLSDADIHALALFV
ncbi:MAG: c-type cytochrome, partial [Pseudomonadota bacterium]